MKVIRVVIIILLIIVSQQIIAQTDTLLVKIVPQTIKMDSLITNLPVVKITPMVFTTQKPKPWKVKNKVGIDLNEVSFSNWNAGGSNSISALARFQMLLDYKKKNLVWNNILRTSYGVNKQQDQELRKTEDQLEIISNLGYRKDTLTNWYFSNRMSFKTQFSNGYKYPNTESPISRFMAPGYFFLGTGVEYGKNIEKLSIYMSPLTLKETFVLDQDLANLGSFGVEPAILDEDGNIIKPGQKVRTEMGILVTNVYETEILKNINLTNRLNLYTDYINSFGNIDVDWEMLFNFKVNKNVQAVLGSHIKYDNDIKIVQVDELTEEEIEQGAKVQWKQLLGIGVTMDF